MHRPQTALDDFFGKALFYLQTEDDRETPYPGTRRAWIDDEWDSKEEELKQKWGQMSQAEQDWCNEWLENLKPGLHDMPHVYGSRSPPVMRAYLTGWRKDVPRHWTHVWLIPCGLCGDAYIDSMALPMDCPACGEWLWRRVWKAKCHQFDETDICTQCSLEKPYDYILEYCPMDRRQN